MLEYPAYSKVLSAYLHSQMFCIRFSISGGEWWDNNHGTNYIVKFGLKDVPPPICAPVTSASSAVVASAHAQGLNHDQLPHSTKPSNVLGLGLATVTRGSFGIDGLPPSPVPEDLIKRLDMLSAQLEAEENARQSSIPFPATAGADSCRAAALHALP